MLFNIHSHFSSKKSNVIFNKSEDNTDEYNYFSSGIHPWHATENEKLISSISIDAVNKKCLAIGEIGLDKLNGSKFEIQKSVFLKQIQISEEMNLPVILHCVKAWNDLEIIKKEVKPKQTWIYHGFNKSNILKNVLENGIMISIGASIFSNIKLQEIINKIPNSSLFLETDDSKIDIFEIYQKVSEIKKISLQELEEIIEQNFKRIFTKWQIG
jgi:TatD DNase family protein